MNQSLMLVGLSAVVLVAYLFDFFGRRTRIPAVVLLIFTGLALRLLADSVGFRLQLPPDVLPVLGTFGLILIVLEGALDLSLTRERAPLIARSSLCALLGVLLTAGLLTGVFMSWFGVGLHVALMSATPLAVISSAVAIPAAGVLSPRLREFVVYESSVSDIVGVVLFYTLLNEYASIGQLLVQVTGELTLSVLAGLSMGLLILWLIRRIEHHVRVLPMIFGITLLYGLGKLWHLAPLVMVLLVGLLLNNTGLLSRISGGRWRNGPGFDTDLESFKHLTAEFTFVVRSFFFVLLGYGTELGELLDVRAWAVAALVIACCLVPRWLLLRLVARETPEPLLWFAPRGLISVLLFISVPATLIIPDFPKAGLMLVILLWALLLTLGSMRAPRTLSPNPQVEPGVSP